MAPALMITTPFTLSSRTIAAAQHEQHGIREALPHITDFGNILGLNSSAAPFTHALNGVDQTANYLFVNILLLWFCLLLGVTFMYRWIHQGRTFLRLLFTLKGAAGQTYWRDNHEFCWPGLKKHLIYAPLGRVRHNRELQLSSAVSIGTLPSRFHTLILGTYLLCNIVYCLVLHWDRENSAEVVAELRGRSGMLACFNLIPTILFALRNNPLINILGVSYESFNLLHRWCARMVVVESIVHTCCWAANAITAGGTHNLNEMLSTSQSYQGGLLGSVAFAVILLTSVGPLRHAFYETFLNAHRLLVLFGLIGVYVHLDKAQLPQLPYLQICFLLWVLEWLVRTARILYLNVDRQKGLTKVTVEALPSEACRVTFDLVRPWKYRPGCHVHAYIPTLSWHSSHPFSVAWGCSKFMPELEMTSVTKQTKMDLERRSPSPLSSPAQPSFPANERVDSISLIVRARTGMTRALWNRANNSKNSRFVTYGALEGPYGGHEDLASYGTVILFAGGVGITHCVGYIKYLLQRYNNGTCSTHRIVLVWSVPNGEALEWVRPWMDEVLKMPGRKAVLKIKVFVTKPRHRGEHSSTSQSLQLFPGRCNPSEILEKEMPERVGAVGVTVCGPGPFADDVRRAVREVVTDGAVDFVEEAFTY